MTARTVVLAVLAALPFTVFGLDKIRGRLVMPETAAHLGVTEAAYRRIGVFEIRGAGGRLVGMPLPVIGAAARGMPSGVGCFRCGASPEERRRSEGGAAPALVAATLVVLYGVVGVNA